MKLGLTIACIFFHVFGYCQLAEGQKIISTSLTNISFSSSKSFAESDINPRIDDHNWGFQIWPEITYGRIKGNKLFSYGVALRYSHDNAENSGNQNRYGIFPIVGLTKYYKITDKIYFTPSFRVMAGYERTNVQASPNNSKRVGNSLSSSFSFNPLGISFEATKKTIVFLGFGRVSFSYERLVHKPDPNDYNFRSVSSIFSFNSSVSNFNIGIQSLL